MFRLSLPPRQGGDNSSASPYPCPFSLLAAVMLPWLLLCLLATSGMRAMYTQLLLNMAATTWRVRPWSLFQLKWAPRHREVRICTSPIVRIERYLASLSLTFPQTRHHSLRAGCQCYGGGFFPAHANLSTAFSERALHALLSTTL